MRKNKILLTLMVGLGGFMLAAPASAQPPERSESSVDLSGPHFLSAVCGTEILQDGTLEAQSTRYADGRMIEHVRVDLELMANGRVAYENPSFTVEIDPGSGTVTISGTLVNIHAPGEGLLLQEAGRLMRDLPAGDLVSVAGHFMLLAGDTDKVCSYFTG